MNITGKTILITGSTDGLGKLVARHMAEQGAKDRTGEYFDRKKPVKAISQAYEESARKELRDYTFGIVGKFL